MKNKIKKVLSINFSRQAYPEVVDIANRLAELEDRSPHGSISRLIVSAGSQKIKQLESVQTAEAV